jgi:hypothetical protein
MWPAQQLIMQLQGSDTAILITAAPPNAGLRDYLVTLLEMTADDLSMRDKNIRRNITVRLPNYNTDLDAPKFTSSNYAGISIHGDPKYIADNALFRNVIIDLFGRMHVCTRTTIGWTQKSLSQLSQYYKRNIIWIDIGAGALTGGC